MIFFLKILLKTEEGADIDGYIKRANNGKSNSDEDIAIEEIVERPEASRKPKAVHVQCSKKKLYKSAHLTIKFYIKYNQKHYE